jgi:hypothetical protein
MALSAAQAEVTFRLTQTDVVTEQDTDFIESVEIFGTTSAGGDLVFVLDDYVSPLGTATPAGDAVTGLPAIALSSASAPSGANAVSVSLA